MRFAGVMIFDWKFGALKTSVVWESIDETLRCHMGSW